jgi:hypothetical protein
MIKRLRAMRAVLTQSPHSHQCFCGSSWLCTKYRCEPVFDLCSECDSRQMEQWIAALDARQQARRAVVL